MLRLQLALRNVPPKHGKWAARGRVSHGGDRDAAYGGDAALPLPRHDLGQAARALRSRVSSSPNQI